MGAAVESESRARRFTADEFWRMVDAGILGAEERLELIDGEIYPVTPSGWDHAWVVEELGRRLGLLFGLDRHVVRMQSTVTGTERYLPEPDIAIRPATGPWLAERRHPRVDEFLLVVEVAATSQYLDRRKTRLYAEAGARVYWIVDIPRRTITIHERSRPDGTWERIVEIGEIGEGGDLEVPGTGERIPVSEVFPPAGQG